MQITEQPEHNDQILVNLSQCQIFDNFIRKKVIEKTVGGP